jgi:uncharacterized protein (DUF1778 family)
MDQVVLWSERPRTLQVNRPGAVDSLGRNRSDFMFERACREAEAVLLDLRYFALPSAEFKRFTAMLDRPRASKRW